jgi:hypothetical protein
MKANPLGVNLGGPLERQVSADAIFKHGNPMPENQRGDRNQNFINQTGLGKEGVDARATR